MAQIAISGLATTTVNGQTYTSDQTFVVDASLVTEQVSDVADTYTNFVAERVQVFFCANLGDEDVLVRVWPGSTDYEYYGIPPGGHILLPSGGQYDSIAIRSLTSAGSRVQMAAIY